MEEGQKVRVMSRSKIEFPESDKLLEMHQADLATASPADLADFLKHVNVLYHMAGMVSRDEADGPAMMELHVEGTRKLLAVAKSVGVKRVVLLSTSGTVGISAKKNYVADDDSPYAMELASKWGYYASKIYQEKLALKWAQETGTEMIALRPSLVMGPGDDRFSSTGDVLKFMQKKFPTIPTGGLSFVDVRDVAKVCLICADVKLKDLKSNPRTYLLGAANWTMDKFMAELEKASGVVGPRIHAGKKLSVLGAKLLNSKLNPMHNLVDLDPVAVEMANYFWYVDASRAKKELGFRFRDPIATVSDTVEYIRTLHPEIHPPKGH